MIVVLSKWDEHFKISVILLIFFKRLQPTSLFKLNGWEFYKATEMLPQKYK